MIPADTQVDVLLLLQHAYYPKQKLKKKPNIPSQQSCKNFFVQQYMFHSRRSRANLTPKQVVENLCDIFAPLKKFTFFSIQFIKQQLTLHTFSRSVVFKNG
jgi:hypothetical protein